MASQLHQAVELAQAGRRDEARQLFLSYLQTNPDHEVAWLWLASVAVTQAEYQHALNQVLRINPANERAQRLLDEFQRQQYGAPPTSPAPASAPPMRPPVVPQVPPTAPPVYTPPYSAEPSGPRWEPPAEGRRYAAPPPAYGAPPPYAEPPRPAPIEVEVREVRRRGCLPGAGCLPGCLGCTGCGAPGCLLALIVLVVLPLVVLGALSYSSVSLGPFDLLATYLPGEFGRKTITFNAAGDELSLKVPRSWLLASEQDDQWKAWRQALETLLPFRDDARGWADFGTVGGQRLILEVNPIALARAGDLIALTYQGTTAGDFACTAAPQAGVEQTYRYGSLCGFRRSTTEPGPGGEVFRAVDPPAHERVITFVVPVTSSQATQWELRLPEEAYASLKGDIDALIESVKVRRASG